MKLGGRMGIGSAETFENFLADLKGRMLPHTGLFLLWKVALQMRIRRRLKTPNAFSDDLLIFPHLYSYVIFPL